MLVYVDDIVIAESTPAAVDRLVWFLSNTFPIKDLGSLEYFLGLEASYNSGGMTLTQRNYVLDLCFVLIWGIAILLLLHWFPLSALHETLEHCWVLRIPLGIAARVGQLVVFDSHTSRYFFAVNKESVSLLAY
jgi:hypothetical protein